jgi:hypothetical protein
VSIRYRGTHGHDAEAGRYPCHRTPSGVGAAFKPPRFLVAGDIVRAEIDGLGHLENEVVPEA